MPRSHEAEWWFNAVYAAVQEIPRGRVTSYAHIARLLGQPQRPRQVGVCLKHLPPYQPGSANEFFNARTVPWQRVINARGGISPRGPGSAERQAAALRREGVLVQRDAMGVWSVAFGEYGWFPEVLPSEAQEAQTEDQDQDQDQDQAEAEDDDDDEDHNDGGGDRGDRSGRPRRIDGGESSIDERDGSPDSTTTTTRHRTRARVQRQPRVRVAAR